MTKLCTSAMTVAAVTTDLPMNLRSLTGRYANAATRLRPTIVEEEKVKCYCEAKLEKCDVENRLCPSSTWRLMRDTTNALRELRDFSKRDERAVKDEMDELLGESHTEVKRHG